MVRRVVLAAMFAVAGCGRSAQAPPPAAPAASPSPQPTASAPPIRAHAQAEGGRYVYFTQQRNNRRIYRIRAVANDIDRPSSKQGRSTFERPQLTFYQPDGSTLLADAQRAVVRESDETVTMTGGVDARTSDGARLLCDRLVYDARTQLLHGQGHVRFTSAQGISASGDRIDGNVRLSQIRISASTAPR